MGLLFWRSNKKVAEEKPKEPPSPSTASITPSAQQSTDSYNGAVMEVPRPAETSVFEFGLAAKSEDGITLAGYCPVSNDIEPCRWEILPTGDPEAPQFRVVF